MFVAQCLEGEISAQGQAVDEAVSRLNARASGVDVRNIGPAPETFHAMYVNSKKPFSLREIAMITLGQYMMWLKSQGGQCKSGIAADH